MGGGGRGAPESTAAASRPLLASELDGVVSAAEDWASARRRTCSIGSLLYASRSAQALARLGACWAQAVRAYPRCILAFGVLVAAIAAGCNLVHASDATLLEAWLPAEGWRQHDQRTAENVWGAQRLDQIIIRPLNGRRWSMTRPRESKEELLTAIRFLHSLSSTLQAGGSNGSTAYKDVCFQPAQPYAPGCLMYSPLAWWEDSEDKFASDPNIWSTLRAPYAAGGVRGLSVKRSDVMSTEEDYEGAVTEVNALMLWLFVDVAPSRATPAYIGRTKSFEDALLQGCAQARANASLPFEAYCSTSSSVEREIQSSAAADVSVVVMTVGALFGFHLVVLCAMDIQNWILNSISACTTGLTLMGVFGCMRACGAYGVITLHPIQAMMLFLPLTMGLHHRVLITGQCRCMVAKSFDHNEKMAHQQGSLLEVLSINILAPAGVTDFAAASAMACASIWTLKVPALQGCAVVGAGGVLLDWVLLATIYLPAVALYQERQQRTSDTKGFANSGEIPSVVRFDGRHHTLTGLPQGLTVHATRRSTSKGTGPTKCCQTASQVQAACMSCYRIFACGGTVLLLAVSFRYFQAFVDGDSAGLLQPYVTTQSLVPAESEIKIWADNYDKYFAPAVSLPIDFPIILQDGTSAALMDPKNGPLLVAAAERLRKDPRLNASSVTDWYGKFRAWCHKSYDGLHLCRNTMTGGDLETGVGYLTPKSFDEYLSLFIAGNEQLAADMQMSGPLLKLKLRAAKFSAVTPAGTAQAYTVQKTLPSAMHTLAERAFSSAKVSRVTAPGHQQWRNESLTAISYSPAFPFFELWEPANQDLVQLGALQLAVSATLCLLFLGLWQSTMVVLCVLATVSLMLSALDKVFQQDLNMVTAVNCMIFVPVGIDLYFHLGFRATALSCLHYRKRAHSDCSCTSTYAAGNVQLSASTTNDLDEHEHAMHSAYLVAVVVLPATIGFAATVGFPLWLLLLCRSPLNALFAYLYQSMLALQACFGLLVLLPLLVPTGYTLSLELLRHLGWFGERALWRTIAGTR